MTTIDEINELLASINELDQKATPGPWSSVEHEQYYEKTVTVEPKHGSRNIAHVTDENKDNALLIAGYRNITPRLASAIQAVLDIAERADRKDIYAPLLDEAVEAITYALEEDGE